jgi:hypothetical protein
MNKSKKRGELADGYFLLESVKHVYIYKWERELKAYEVGHLVL